MINDRFNVLGVLSNPENCDLLHIYAIINFNPQKEALIRQQAVNHLNLFPIGVVKGVVILNKKESAVRMQDPTQQEYSIDLKNTKIFCTNDEIKGLLENKGVGFACSINSQWMPNKNVELYYIQNAEVDLSELFKLEYETTEDNPINQSYYEITLVSFDDLVNLNNTKIKFQIINYRPNIDKINWIEYTFPNTAVYQTLSVFGNLENKETGEILENILLPLEFYEGNGYSKPQALPILALPDSLTAPAKLNIKSFNLNYQLPYVIARHITTGGRGLRNTWEKLIGVVFLSDGSSFGKTQADLLHQLMIRMYFYTWLYNSNFEIWESKKTDSNFVNMFNTTFANKSVYEFNKDLVDDFLLKNKGFKNSVVWDIFKALCLACSDFIVSPFMWNKGNDGNFKNFLWYYFDSNVSDDSEIYNKKDNINFDSQTFALKPEIYKNDITVNLKSNFFNQDTDGNLHYKNNTLIDVNLNTKQGEYISIPKIPDIVDKIENSWSPYTEEDSNEKIKYLCFLFFNSAVDEFVSKWLEYSLTSHYNQTQYIVRNDRPVVADDFKRFIPKEAFNIKPIQMSDNIKETFNIYEDCGKQYNTDGKGKWYIPSSWIKTIPARHGENPPPNSTKQNYCSVWYDKVDDLETAWLFLSGQIGLDPYYVKWSFTPMKNENTRIELPRKIIGKNIIYKAYSPIEFDVTQKIVNNFYLQDETGLKMLLNPNNDKSKEKVKIRLQLSKEWSDKGWVINSITSDKHKSFFDSARDITINFDNWYIDEDSQQKKIENNIEFYYILDYSFQKNSPANCMTQNKY